MHLTLSILVFVLVASCTPTSYNVDTRPYAEAIADDPSAVSIQPEHVTPVGTGFSGLEFTGSLRTDHGTISTDGKTVDISIDPMVIDARSGK